MNAFEVSTVLTCAACIAASTLTGPAEKLSIAGTRPMVCSAMNTTATPAEFGSSTPTFSPAARAVLELAAQHLGAEDHLAIGQAGAERVLDDRLAGIAVAMGMRQRFKQGVVHHGVLDHGVDHDVL